MVAHNCHGKLIFTYIHTDIHTYIHTYIHNLYLTWEKLLAIAILQVFHKLILRKKEICT